MITFTLCILSNQNIVHVVEKIFSSGNMIYTVKVCKFASVDQRLPNRYKNPCCVSWKQFICLKLSLCLIMVIPKFEVEYT